MSDTASAARVLLWDTSCASSWRNHTDQAFRNEWFIVILWGSRTLPCNAMWVKPCDLIRKSSHCIGFSRIKAVSTVVGNQEDIKEPFLGATMQRSNVYGLTKQSLQKPHCSKGDLQGTGFTLLIWGNTDGAFAVLSLHNEWPEFRAFERERPHSTCNVSSHAYVSLVREDKEWHQLAQEGRYGCKLWKLSWDSRCAPIHQRSWVSELEDWMCRLPGHFAKLIHEGFIGHNCNVTLSQRYRIALITGSPQLSHLLSGTPAPLEWLDTMIWAPAWLSKSKYFLNSVATTLAYSSRSSVLDRACIYASCAVAYHFKAPGLTCFLSSSSHCSLRLSGTTTRVVFRLSSGAMPGSHL